VAVKIVDVLGNELLCVLTVWISLSLRKSLS
jgi:hypothetical protein